MAVTEPTTATARVATVVKNCMAMVSTESGRGQYRWGASEAKERTDGGWGGWMDGDHLAMVFYGPRMVTDKLVSLSCSTYCTS